MAISNVIQPDLKDVLAKNGATIDNLVNDLEQGCHLVPFVGAGLSFAYGFLTWATFLERGAKGTRIESEVRRLISAGQFEAAAEKLRLHMGALAFEDSFAAEYGKAPNKPVQPSAATLMARLSTGFSVTSNYEEVLPTTLREVFNNLDVLEGNAISRVSSALRGTRPSLWMMHGAASERASRVLTQTEYKERYEQKFDDGEPIIVRLLNQVFTSRIVLFAGCSLGPDRTMDVMKSWAGWADGHHYAIVELPTSEEFDDRARFLAERRIRPIWYPIGAHQSVQELLGVIVERTARFVSRTRQQGGVVISLASRLRDGESTPKGDFELDLSSRFDNQRIRSEESWGAAQEAVCQFLVGPTALQRPMKLKLNAHLSLSFLAGSRLPVKRGASVTLTQFGKGGEEFWSAADGKDGVDWEVSCRKVGNGNQWALAIEGFPNMRRDVIHHCEQHLPNVGTLLLLCQPGEGIPTVAGGQHARRIVEQCLEHLSRNRPREAKKELLHVFIGGPTSLAFLLGQEIFGLGPTQLYEYVRDDQEYVASITVSR